MKEIVEKCAHAYRRVRQADYAISLCSHSGLQTMSGKQLLAQAMGADRDYGLVCKEAETLEGSGSVTIRHWWFKGTTFTGTILKAWVEKGILFAEIPNNNQDSRLIKPQRLWGEVVCTE